jgi:hypothetical protein
MTTISLYHASVPVFIQTLEALSGTLGKAAAHAAAKRFDESVFMHARLAPDMFALPRQVQIAADFAKGASARLAGIDMPRFADDEATLAQLQARLARTVEFLRTITREAIDGQEERQITLSVAQRTLEFRGLAYLLHFAKPNFYFHATCAYAILRANGVEIGKADFVGQF